MIKAFPFVVLIAVMAAIGVFLFSRGNENGDKAKYTNGVSELEMGGTKYAMINDLTTEVYVGSQVRVIVGAERGEQVGMVRSMGIFTLAKLFQVVGDTDGKYLVDNNGRLYAKSDIADAERARLAADESFSKLRIVGAEHDPQKSTELSAEEATMLRALVKETADTTVTDKSFVTDYSNRREVFAYTSDGIFRKVVMELFLYKNEVYLTIDFAGDKNTMKEQKLMAVKLPKEVQERFSAFWR